MPCGPLAALLEPRGKADSGCSHLEGQQIGDTGGNWAFGDITEPLD